MRKSVHMKNNIPLNESQLRNVIHKTITKMLSENANINDYVNLEPALRAFGRDVASMAYAIADYLFKAGLDYYEFTRLLQKKFKTLNAEGKKGDATVMGLISAIKNSKTYLDVTRGWEGEEAGYCRLKKPVSVMTIRRKPFEINDLIYGISNGKPYFAGYGNSYSENGGDTLAPFSPNQIREIMSVIE